MSFYQTYRPKKIAELDLFSVREVLLSSLSSGRISHAYLFVGPRGSGKTSAARILAQIVNCKENQGKSESLVEPCGACEACLTIAKGSSTDVIEIDAASNGLVDDIRELRDRVRLTPAQLAKKVYIIDEVHMVSSAGFNALLKTLEEPPEHALFILCTTEAQKVPETIASRCARVSFSKATMEEVVSSLMKVVEGEKIEADQETLQEIAEATDGSFREGHKLLEQITAFGRKIDRAILTRVLGTAGRSSVKKLLMAAVGHETEVVIKTFDEMESRGTKAPVLAVSLLTLAKAEMESCLSEGVSPKIYLNLINSLIEAADKVKISPLPLLPLEIALLSVAVDDGESLSVSRTEPVAERTQPTEEKKEKVDSKKDTRSLEGGLSLEDVKTGWGSFLSYMSESNGSLAGMLRLVQPMYVDGKAVVFSVTSRFQQEMLEREVKKKVIEEQMARVWGPLTFRCVLTDKIVRTQPSLEDENIAPVSDGEESARGVLLTAEKIFG